MLSTSEKLEIKLELSMLLVQKTEFPIAICKGNALRSIVYNACGNQF